MQTEESTAPQSFQKLSSVWSTRRECQVAVRIHYQMHVDDGCKIYKLSQVEELD